jgi:hypothetical protein
MGPPHSRATAFCPFKSGTQCQPAMQPARGIARANSGTGVREERYHRQINSIGPGPTPTRIRVAPIRDGVAAGADDSECALDQVQHVHRKGADSGLAMIGHSAPLSSRTTLFETPVMHEGWDLPKGHHHGRPELEFSQKPPGNASEGQRHATSLTCATRSEARCRPESRPG